MMNGHPVWMSGLAKLLVLLLVSCRGGFRGRGFAAHKRHYTALLSGVHGRAQYWMEDLICRKNYRRKAK
jgi:hypothetical protein